MAKFCCWTLSLSDYKNEKMFLWDVAIRLHKGEEVYAMVRNNGQDRYGKITSESDQLVIHACSLTKVDRSATVILLEDFKNCIGEIDFFPFIEVPSPAEGENVRFCFKMVDSILAAQFVKLCTGETGPLYKEALYSQGKDITKKAQVVPKKSSSEYLESSEESEECYKLEPIKSSSKVQPSESIKSIKTLPFSPPAFDGNSLFGAGKSSSSVPVFKFSEPVKTSPVQTPLKKNLSLDSETKSSSSSKNSLTAQSILQVEYYLLNGDKTRGKIDYNLSSPNSKCVSFKNVILTAQIDGEFQIYYSNEDVTLSNVIGVGIDIKEDCPDVEYDEEVAFIEDSGFVMRLSEYKRFVFGDGV